MQSHARVPLPDWCELPEAEMRARAAAFLATMRRRHTVRDFAERPVAWQVIADCIAAAGTAPSGANHQPWFFAAIGTPEVKRRLRALAEAEEREFYAGKGGAEWLDALKPLGTDASKPHLEIAPWIIAVFGQRRGGMGGMGGGDRKNYYVPESVGIATGFLIAALHQSGLVVLTHTPKPMSFLNDLCGRPPSEKPYLLIVTGHPAPDATVPEHALEKKPLEAIVARL